MTEPLPHSSPQPPRQQSSRRGCFFAVALFAGLMLLFLLGLVGLFVYSLRSLGPPAVRVTSGSVLEIGLSGVLSESPSEVDFGPWFGATPLSLWEIRRGLRHAATDDDIAAVRLWIHDTALGWSTAEELLTLLDEIRAADKPVYAMLQAEMVSDLDYFLATGADRIWISPETTALINGLAAEVLFHRGTLDKLHIEPQVLMYEEYKSAGEPYSNYEMSPYMRESLTAVLETISDRFRRRVLNRRDLGAEALEQLMARGVAPADALVEAQLVDALGYGDEVDEALRLAADQTSYRAVSLTDYLESLGRERRGGTKIAVLFGEGTIVSQPVSAPLPFLDAGLFSGPVVARNIRRAVEDPSVEAIVLRVNSPGGSAVGSDMVRREVERSQAAGKPVVVSMSDYAASGGYWVAMGADAIVAHDTTLTGSIGVVFTKFNLQPFFDWIGTNVDEVLTEPNADILGLGSWDERDRAAVESWMEGVYGDFVEGVAKGRELPLARVREIARGRVWSGRDALDLDLVDQLGDFDDAIRLAQELAEVDERTPAVSYPPPRPLFQQMFEEEWSSIGAALGLASERERFSLWLERMQQPRVQALAPTLRIR